MAAEIATTPASNDASGPVPPASPTGYETFLQDSAKIAVDSAQQAQGMITNGAQQAQGAITSYFPPVKDACDGTKNMCSEGGLPRLTASSSSEKSGVEEDSEKKEKLSWTEKLSSCHMDTACGELDIEFMKKEQKPATPKGPAVTEQGELLQIEAPPPPKPWTEELSEDLTGKVQQAQKTTNKLFVSLGLVEKKDQALITDFYPTEAVPKEPEKPLSEKLQEVQANISQTAQSMHSSVATSAQSASASVMAKLGLASGDNAPEEKEVKEKQQSLITDFDPARSVSKEEAPEPAPDAKEETPEPASAIKEEAPAPASPVKEEVLEVASTTKEEAPAPASATEEEVPEPAPVAKEEASVAEPSTEQPSLVAESESVVTEPTIEIKESWNLWKQVKGFMSRFAAIPEKTPTCEEIAAMPGKIDMPSCPTPKAIDDMPSSLAIFNCDPKKYEEEPETKPVETQKVGEEQKKEETETVEETKKPETPMSPDRGDVPW